MFDFFIIQEIWYAIVLVTVYNERIVFWLSLVNNWKCLVPNKNKLIFSSNHVTSCNSRNNNHSKSSKMTIVLLKRSKVLVVTPCLKQPWIINHTNHLRRLSSLKPFMVNKNVRSNTIGLKSTHSWTMMLKKIQWLAFFASDRTQTCFYRDVGRKPFSKQVTKTGKTNWKVWQAPAV